MEKLWRQLKFHTGKIPFLLHDQHCQRSKGTSSTDANQAISPTALILSWSTNWLLWEKMWHPVCRYPVSISWSLVMVVHCDNCQWPWSCTWIPWCAFTGCSLIFSNHEKLVNYTKYLRERLCILLSISLWLVVRCFVVNAWDTETCCLLFFCLWVTLSTKSMKFGNRYLVHRLSEWNKIRVGPTVIDRALLYMSSKNELWQGCPNGGTKCRWRMLKLATLDKQLAITRKHPQSQEFST